MQAFVEGQEIPAETLNGDGIYLRPYLTEDFAALKEYRQDPENCRFIRPAESDQKIKEFIQHNCEPWRLKEGRWNGLVICLSGDTQPIGDIAFKIEDWENQRVELGYRVSGRCAGKGVATRAAGLIIEYLFNQLHFHKVVAKCDPRNIGSIRIMEKSGLTQEACFKQHFRIGDEWTDQLDYGLLRTDWLKLS